MKPSVKLPETVFERFLLTCKPFAFINDEIYTMEDNKYIVTDNTWEHLDKKFSLFKSDNLSKFTNHQLSDAQEDVHKYMSWIINFKYIRKLENVASNFSQNLDYYKELKQNSIDKLITDVFYIFNHKQNSEMDEDLDLDTTVESFPSINDLKDISSVINEIIPKPGVMVRNNVCYTLEKGNPNGNGILTFNGEQYTLKRLMDLDELVKDYSSRLKGEIEGIAISHGEKFQEQIKTINDRLSKCKEEIGRVENLKGIKKMGSVGYQKLDANDYLFFAEIEPFILGKDGVYYAFHENNQEGSKKIRIGSRVTIDADSLCIHNKPKVIDIPYFHPFVHSSGDICYADGSRWSYYGIKFTPHKYKHSDQGIARKMAYLLWEGTYAIVDGVIGSRVGPVHNLSRFNVIAKSEQEAIQYARQNNIDEKRIFNN